MAVYEITGPTRDTLNREGAAEVLPVDAEVMAVIAGNIESIRKVGSNIAALPDLQATLTQALSAAANAAAAASAAQAAAQGITGVQAAVDATADTIRATADEAAVTAAAVDQDANAVAAAMEQAATSVTAAQAAADIARNYSNAPAGVEVEPGKPGIQTYLAMAQNFLSRAPNLQGKTYDGGGTDNVLETVVLDESFLGKAVRINRTALRAMKFKVAGGLFQGPPEEGNPESWAWVHFMRQGDGDVLFEGSGSTGPVTTVFPPLVTTSWQLFDSLGQLTPARAAYEVTLAPAITAGVNRKVIVFCASVHYTTPTTDFAARADVFTGITNPVKTPTAAGWFSAASPIKGSIFLADLPDSYVGTPKFYVTIPADISAYIIRLFILQDVTGVEDLEVTPRAGAATDEQIILTPTVARSTVMAMAVHLGADASPVTLGTGDLQEASTTGGTRILKDLAFATNRRKDVPASAQTLTGSSAKAGPALIMGASFKPRSQTTPGGTSNLTYDATAIGGTPKIPNKGGQATLYLSSDGLSAWLDA